MKFLIGNFVKVINPNDVLYWEVGTVIGYHKGEDKYQIKIKDGPTVWYIDADLELIDL